MHSRVTPLALLACAVACGLVIGELTGCHRKSDVDACSASPSDAKSEALVDAARDGDFSAIDRLLAEGADARFVDGRENPTLKLVTCDTALQQAAARGYAVMARKLIVAGADPNHRAFAKWTPLHYAAQGGYLDCVDVLLEAKADVNAQTSLGFSPLSEAVAASNLEVARRLVVAGANPDLADRDGRTARDIAQDRGEQMKLLLPAR